jgi:hypothetical protein
MDQAVEVSVEAGRSTVDELKQLSLDSSVKEAGRVCDSDY